MGGGNYSSKKYYGSDNRTRAEKSPKQQDNKYNCNNDGQK